MILHIRNKARYDNAGWNDGLRPVNLRHNHTSGALVIAYRCCPEKVLIDGEQSVEFAGMPDVPAVLVALNRLFEGCNFGLCDLGKIELQSHVPVTGDKRSKVGMKTAA